MGNIISPYYYLKALMVQAKNKLNEREPYLLLEAVSKFRNIYDLSAEDLKEGEAEELEKELEEIEAKGKKAKIWIG